jgi:signal peptidase II
VVVLADFQETGELKREERSARPSLGRAFLKRHSVVLPDLAAHLIFWPTVAVGIALDLWSKNAAFNWLQIQRRSSVSIIEGFLRLVIALNDGAAFGLFSGKSHLLTVVSIVALIGILAIFLFSGTERKLVNISLALFAAGVCGNLYDRIFNDGLVRDFIDVVYWPGRHWPAFNIADSMLCIAVGLLLISTFWVPKRPLLRLGSRFTGKSFQKRGQRHK